MKFEKEKHMKALFCDFGTFTYQDLLYFFNKLNIQCKTFFYHFENKYEDPFCSKRLARELDQTKYDFVFSINFYPLVATACAERKVKYLSWSYDSPLEEGLQPFFDYETNYLFIFDRIEAEQYNRLGHSRIFHLPLAVNANRYRTYLDSGVRNYTNAVKYGADVSLVGQIYDSPLDDLLYSADAYTRGYIESIFQAQLRVYGANFVENVITDELLERIHMGFIAMGQNKVRLNKRGLAYAINSKITQAERSFLLSELSEICKVNLYSSKPANLAPGVNQKGPVGYFDKMPLIFYYSKLNLNPTLKSIQSGIPLRALDIMACGGVLFSNYQPELAEYFVEGEEVIMYGSMEEAIEKAAYYLKREETLHSIAKRGESKVREEFSYPDRIETMLKLAKII